MKKIKLTKNKYALVDDEDYKELVKYKWQVNEARHTDYATRTSNRKTIRMHRVIMNPPHDLQVDHKDCNGLNNQRENLRACTQSQNIGNRGVMKNNTSGIKGVHWDKNAKKWRARLGKNGKRVCLGLFSNKNEAENVYMKAAKEFFREYYFENN